MGNYSINNPGALYRQRAKDYFRFQYKAVTSVVDLTILLYIVIPGLLLLSRLYYDFLHNPLPVTIAHLPLGTGVTLLLLITGTRGLIMHLEPADILFLHNRPRWMRSLKARGILASAGYLAVLAGLGGLVLAPLFTRIYEMNAAGIVLLCLAVFCFRTVHMLLLNFCRMKWTGWRSAVIRWVLNLVVLGTLNTVIYTGQTFPAVIPAAAVIAAALAVLLAFVRLGSTGTFYADVNEDSRQKTRLIALMLSSSIDKPKLPKSKTLLFRRSGKLFFFNRTPAARMAEIAVKSILRSRSILWFNILYTLIGAAALQLPPYPVNAIAFVCLILLQAYWLNGMRRLFNEEKFLTLLPEDEHLQFQAATLIMRTLLIPPVAVYAISLAWAVSPTLLSLPAGLCGGMLLGWWAGSWVWKVLGGWRGKKGKAATFRSR